MEKNYLDNKNKNICNGCGVCKELCPVGAIKMVEDGEGFLYPEIDEGKCINCKKCRTFCSNYPSENKYKIKAYAAKFKDDIKRQDSTSGGMFKILSEYVLEKGGIVFGVELDENLRAVHSFSDNVEGCRKYSGSKYVRSDINNSYKKVREFLKNDRYVLFSGTPCQVHGLRLFLNKDYEKLILCEIICHSNPSPKVLEMYIKNIEKNYGKRAKSIFFRSKNTEMNNGPYIEFEDGSKVSAKLYIKAFTGEKLISRPSCSNCQFADKNRKADFTVGDFWGIEKVFPDFDDKKGISLLTVNTDKANKIFESVKDKMYYKETDIDLAFRDNHHSNIPPSKYRKVFFEGVSSGKINEDNIVKYMKKYTKRPLYKRVLGRYKK